jgi:hypothetical protein
MFHNISLSLHCLSPQLDELYTHNPHKRNVMQKSRLNLILEPENQRTTVSEVFTQSTLKLKRYKENDPTKIILADPAFSEALIEITEKIKERKVEWRSYVEVFE